MEGTDVVEVYVTARPYQAHFLRNMLADTGIEARVLGEYLNMVDPPANLQSGAIWVRRQDAEMARQILTEWEQAQAQPHSEKESAASWRCSSCGETVEDNFDLCWNCETPRP